MGGGKNGNGINLLTGTKDFSSDKWMNLNNPYNIPRNMLDPEKYLGFSVMSRSEAWNWPIYKTEIMAKSGEIYTVSLYAKADSENAIQLSITNTYIEGSCRVGSISGTQRSINKNWKRYAVSYAIETDGIICVDINSLKNGKAYVCGMKLERGYISDPIWTPAIEDVVLQNDFDALAARVAALEGNIN